MQMPFAVIVFLLILFSPIESSRAWDMEDLKKETMSGANKTMLVGTGLTLGALALRNPVGQNFEDEQKDRRILGSYSSLGDYAGQLVPNAGYVLYQYYLGSNGDSKGYQRAMGMLKATSYASAVTTVLKYSIRAPRPNDNSIRNSFPSGHSATVFAFSGYVAAEHGWGWGAAASSISIYCGYSRIHDQMHRLHEVIAGATIGMAYGFGISKLQNSEKSDKTSGTIGGFSVAPIIDLNTKGISLYKEF